MMREVQEDAKAMLDDAMYEETPVKARAVSVPSTPLKEPSTRKRRLNMDVESPQASQAPVPLPERAAQPAPRPMLPIGTMLRYHPASVPTGSVNDHYTAIQLRDGAVLQVKTPADGRPKLYFKTVEEWLARLPGQPVYEDLIIEYK
jgi:hypothetical protein